MSVAVQRRPSTLALARSGPLSITARGISKAFGARRVIANLDLHVQAGQFLAVVGRSGCGKSTLLRLLSGLEQPDSGSLQIGEVLAASHPQSAVRLMFQEPRLLPWASVADNVTVGFGQSKPFKARDLTIAALDDVGLGDRANVWPSTLSGGQKQRVALARALISGPSILALDEPLGALDALTRLEMQGLIERIFLAEQLTTILVTHDVSEAVALADRIIMIENGRISLDVEVPYSRPRRRGDPDVVAMEQRILSRLMNPLAGA